MLAIKYAIERLSFASYKKRANMPTLILAWEDDMAHPVSTAEALAESLPEVRRLDIISPHDQPDWTRTICGFLQEISPRKRTGRQSA